jgi:hypothetical protein
VGKKCGLTSGLLGDLPFAFIFAKPLKIKNLQVGDVKAHNVSAVVMDHPYLKAMSKVFGPVEGLVGFPFFARYSMTIDYQAKTLTFLPSNYEPHDLMDFLKEYTSSFLAPKKKLKAIVLKPAAQWGFKVQKEKGDDEAGVTVSEVLASSASALAGMKKGDRVLSVDGHWTDTVVDCYRAASHIKAGTTVVVVVKREGKEMDLKVKPALGF